LQIGGWAIPPNGHFGNTTILVGDREPDEIRIGLPTPELQRVFYFVPGSGYCGFSFSTRLTEEELELRDIRISLVNKHTKSPYFHWHDIYLPCERIQYAEPEPERIARTSGNKQYWKYRVTGYTVAAQLQKLLKTYFQRPLASFDHVLDWGSGCGRLTQSLLSHAPELRITGVDIDRNNVDWCQCHVHGARFLHCDLLPPLDLDRESVDLLIGVSVITHQTLEVQRAWRDELARVMKPGGVLILSFNGEFTIAKGVEERVLAVLSSGFDAEHHDPNLEGFISDPAYYRLTLQTRKHFISEFSGQFDVIDIIPAGCGSVQDFAVLQKK
jgi:SAM-dependent methyltransferase